MTIPADFPRHVLELTDLSADEVRGVLDLAGELRRGGVGGYDGRKLAGKSLAMVFEKPSLRTRVSFEVAMNRLGGSAINLQPAEIGLGTREPARDVARVLGRMCDLVMARVFDHATIFELARHCPAPVVNGLSDLAHPCQALADALTIRDAFGDERGRRVCYVGDANNVMRSLAAVCGRLGMPFVACNPVGYTLGDEEIDRLRQQVPGLDFTSQTDPIRAAEGAHVLYTDTWTSMGQEAEKQARVNAFAGYTVDARLLEAAAPGAVVLHCLPAYRGLEITDDVLEGPASRVFEQAENRLHAQAALLVVLVGTAGTAGTAGGTGGTA